MTKKTCEICGYEGDPHTVFERPDGITRCRVCAWRSFAPGKAFVDESEAHQLYDAGVRPNWMDPDDPLNVDQS